MRWRYDASGRVDIGMRNCPKCGKMTKWIFVYRCIGCGALKDSTGGQWRKEPDHVSIPAVRGLQGNNEVDTDKTGFRG
jgi:endogenous inhibitor of DNA gyrase (YacG/DUF329 family)